MKKLMGAAIAAGATVASAAVAHADISANIQLTTDYVFRGVSLSNNSAAVQGGFDWSNNQFYAGVWASSLSVPAGSPASPLELDVYAGWTPATGPVSWDFGIVTYNYPGAEDKTAAFDYYELKGAGTWKFNDHWSAGAALYYTPHNWGGTGEARYWEVNGEYDYNDMLHFSGAYGNQEVADPNGPLPGKTRDDYDTWNVGATIAFHGFELDLRYHDTDVKAGSSIENYTYGPSSYDARYVATIKRQL